jgi:hypothetical protein
MSATIWHRRKTAVFSDETISLSDEVNRKQSAIRFAMGDQTMEFDHVGNHQFGLSLVLPGAPARNAAAPLRQPCLSCPRQPSAAVLGTTPLPRIGPRS